VSLCGARVGGRQACQEIFNELSAQAWSSPARGSVHNLVVDAYAMQHSEEYGRSVKSYIAHLTALCCGVEAAGDRELYWQIPRWLDGRVDLVRPQDLPDRGSLTIADVRNPAREEEYPELVRRWASDVWQAYAVLHETARQWLNEARAHRVHASPHRRH
jgi:hypothetical protein